MLVKLEWLRYRMVKKNYDDMLSRFHLIPGPSVCPSVTFRYLIPERYGRTDRRTDLVYQYRASVCWRAIKTVYSCNGPKWVKVTIINHGHLWEFLPKHGTAKQGLAVPIFRRRRPCLCRYFCHVVSQRLVVLDTCTCTSIMVFASCDQVLVAK